MEIIKNDMTVDEMRYTVALLLSLKTEDLKGLKSDVLIKMLNALNANALAYNSLEDKYRELMQAGTYKPLSPKVNRERGRENREIGRQLRELNRKG